MAKRTVTPPPLEEKVFQSPDEIDFAIKKLERRITDIQELKPTISRYDRCRMTSDSYGSAKVVANLHLPALYFPAL